MLQNVSIITDGAEVRMARQNALLEPGEPFFGWEAVLERYEWPVCHIFNRLSPAYPEMLAIAVCGVLFHPTEGDEEATDFFAYDIYVFTEKSGWFLPKEEANALFSVAGLMYAHGS